MDVFFLTAKGDRSILSDEWKDSIVSVYEAEEAIRIFTILSYLGYSGPTDWDTLLQETIGMDDKGMTWTESDIRGTIRRLHEAGLVSRIER